MAYLPTANASVIYIDVDALRRSGILGMLAGSKTAEEPDYQQFVQETKFDYRQDLDAVAAALKDGRIYFALRGRFHWSNLRDYAARQGGSCHNDFCVVAGSQPNRRISFYPLKSNVLAMAIGPDDFGAYQVAVQPSQARACGAEGARVGADSGRRASKYGFIAGRREGLRAGIARARIRSYSALAPTAAQQLQLGLHVTCKDAAGGIGAAHAVRNNHQSAARIARRTKRQKPDPADLSGVLVAGSFRRDERQVYGTWPISKGVCGRNCGDARTRTTVTSADPRADAKIE